MNHSLEGYEPIDSIVEDAPIGHGVAQNFGAEHKKKATFWKSKGGRQYARRPDGRIITHDAEELADISGVDSVVVEAPIGHGATQYFAEDSVTYSMAGEVGFEELEEPEVKAVMKKHGIKIVDREAIERVEWGGIMGHGDIDYIYFQSKSLAGMEALDSLIFDGDMKNEGDIKIVRNAEGDAATYAPSNDPDMVNSIPTEPTNAEADLFGAESKNKWVKGKNGKTYVLRKKTGRMVTHNAETKSCVTCGDSVDAEIWDEELGFCVPCSHNYFSQEAENLDNYTTMDSITENDTSYQPAQNYGADFTLEQPVKTGFMVALGAGLFSLAAVAGTVLVGNLLGGKQE